MMTVLFVNRNKKYGGYSVEELFTTIQNELKSYDIDVINYEYNTSISLKKNINQINSYFCNIIHITSGLPQLIRKLDTNKTIFTVHDINRYLFDLKGVKKNLYKQYYLKPLKKLKYITAISEVVKLQLVKSLNINPQYIEVIPNCYRPSFIYSRKIFNFPNPRILHIGTKKWKNLNRLIKAVSGINCTLVIIGKISDDTRKKLQDYKIKFEEYYDLSYTEVYNQFILSDIVSFISLYEGFGMPIIEAQAVGRPVITSNISSMPEIAGEGALLVNPYDIDEIEKGIIKLIKNETYRNQLIQKGFSNIQRFTSKKIANEYLSFYEKIISNNNDSN